MSSLNDNLLDKTSKEIKETQKRILYSEKLRFRFPGDFKSILRQLYPINKLNSISIAIKEKVTVQKQNFEFNEKMYYNGLEIEDFFGDGNVEKQKSEQKESLSEIYQLEEDESYFDWLPEELILMIFEYLDKPHHLCFCEATCQMFFRISNEPLLWRRVLQENAPYIDFIYVHESAYRSLGTPYNSFLFSGVMGLTKYFEDEYLSSFSQEELLEFQQDEKQEQEKITKFPNKRKPKPNQTIKEPTLYPKLLGNKRKILLQNARYDEETVSLIRNDPRKLFLDQIKKIDYEIKKCKKKHDFFWKYNRNKKADQAILAFHGGVLPIVSSLSFFITILLICLKKDLVIETSYKLIFIPIEILWWCIVYIGFCFNLSREDMPMYVFGRALYLSGFFTFWFTLLLSIKLDDEDIFPWFVILIPHFLSFGAWIYFCWHIFSRIREEDNFLVNIFVLHIIIYHTFFSLFLVLIVLNKHDIGSISQNSLFYYMFAVCFSPVFFAIFWPFFIRYCRRKIHSWSDLHHLPDFYGSYFEIDLISFGMLMIPFVLIFVQLLIIYLKLNQKIFCEWIVVGTPSFISLGIFLIISVVGEILYAIDEYF